MTKFFTKPSGLVVGCDPGPQHSAFALLDCRGASPFVSAVAYVPNEALHHAYATDLHYVLRDYGEDGGRFASLGGFGKMTFAFERCSVQAGGANAMVFETCMMAGEIRHMVREAGCDDMHSFTPSEWRYVLTGQACAKDANVRAVLLTLDPECDILSRKYSTKAKKMLGLKKPITSHLRDAIGVAYACGFVGYRKGLSLEQFPARLEVHCG